MELTTELLNQMKEVERGQRLGTYYRLADVLTTMICGSLCKIENIGHIYKWSQAEPTRKFLKEQFGIVKLPCRAQFYNIIASVNPDNFGQAFIRWVQYAIETVEGKTIAGDGKKVRSAEKMTGNPLNIVSAIISENNLVVGSIECEDKESEITAFRELIEMIDVAGAMVVADALHCQKKTAQTVVENGGDYLFVVKDNHETLKDDIETYFQNPPKELEKHITTEKNGGRIETRTAFVEHEIDWVYGKDEWAKLACIGAIHREFEKNGKKTSEWHYYISSQPLTAENLLKHARLEWAVESMHWMLDVHWHEDKTRARDINVQKTLNIMRKIALNLAREYKAKVKPKSSISGILLDNLFDLRNLSALFDFFFALFPHNVTTLLIS